MKVIAIKEGYYGAFREVGAEFDVKAGEKATWFKPVDEVGEHAGEIEPDGHDDRSKQGKGAKGKQDADPI